MKRKLFFSLGIAPALLGAALAAGVTLASPGDASAAGPCTELAAAYLYHNDQGNTAYMGQLRSWARGYGCFWAG
jgi:hypothetical protein